MNDKQKELNRILDTVVECCSFDLDDNVPTVTREVKRRRGSRRGYMPKEKVMRMYNEESRY